MRGAKESPPAYPDAMSELPERSTKGHPFLAYTFARILLLLVVGGVCYLIGFRDLLLIVLAFIVSGIISFFVLNRQRDALGMGMGAYFSRMNQKIDAGTKSEDQIIMTTPEVHAASEATETETR